MDFFRLTVNDIIDQLEELPDSWSSESEVDDSDHDPDYTEPNPNKEDSSEDEDEEMMVIMNPPQERAGGDTDEDSDDSDNPSSCAQHLPRRLLGGQGEAVVLSGKRKKKVGLGKRKRRMGEDDTEEEEVPPVAAAARVQITKNIERDWTTEDTGMVGSKVPKFEKPGLSAADQEKIESCNTAFDYYKLFNTDSFLNNTIYQSRLYAVQKQKEKHMPNLNVNTLRCTEAMLLHSGYNSLPSRRMMWEQKPDCRNDMVADNIRRDEVDSVLTLLHFRDNQEINEDGFYKVRPIFHSLNKGGRFFVDEEKYSVDECMIPYFGRHSAKQFIHGKPVRYGFKVWSLCTTGGAGVTFEPYCGNSTNITDAGLGQGPNVVLDLVEKSSLTKGSLVYMDNLFTSFPLLDRMSGMGLGATGTLRQNR